MLASAQGDSSPHFRGQLYFISVKVADHIFSVRHVIHAHCLVLLHLLLQVYQQVCCIPASSVTAEAVFSVAGRVITKRRASLSASRINDSIFLNFNNRQREKSEIKLYSTLFQNTREVAQNELVLSSTAATEEQDLPQETEQSADDMRAKAGDAQPSAGDDGNSSDEEDEAEQAALIEENSITSAKDFLELVQPTLDDEEDEEVITEDDMRAQYLDL